MHQAFSGVLVLLFLSSLAAAGGNLSVSINAEGDLVVIGDGEANRVGITPKGIFGNEVHHDGTINGIHAPFPIPPIRGRLLVDLGAGADRLSIIEGIAEEQVFLLGDGNDSIDIGSGSWNTTVDGGAGDDSINVESNFHRLRVFAGAGDDRVTVHFSYVTEGAHVLGEGGNDLVRLSSSFFLGPVTVTGGSGFDGLQAVGNAFLGSPPKVVGFEVAHPRQR